MKTVAGLCLGVALCACSGASPGGGEVTCDPRPQITSSPETVATVGQRYVYYVSAASLCGLWTVCNDFVGVELPDGATIDFFYDSIEWTPPPDQANRDVRFEITTEPDTCGDVARQSWTVHVNPAAPSRRTTGGR